MLNATRKTYMRVDTIVVAPQAMWAHLAVLFGLVGSAGGAGMGASRRGKPGP